jgi:hypothetical protein
MIAPECVLDPDPTAHFDPENRRNPNVPAVPVTLADGRTWHFASATDRYRPDFVGDICVGAVAYRGFPATCQGPMDALIAASQEDAGSVPVSLVIQAAVVLLRKAHNLSAGEAAALLHLGEAELPEVVRGLSAAARGETEAAYRVQVEPEDLDSAEPTGGPE